MTPNWVASLDYNQLQQQGRAIFRHQGKQIALFATEQGVFACNNRCPHEGYPLREGTLDDCILTCHWHNWKFDLNTGANLYGGDRLRIYATELRDGVIWLDLSDPPFETQRNEALSNLKNAFEDNDYTRLARELGRLRLLGADPLDALRAAIHWSCDKLEFGWTHAYAGAADWLNLYDEFQDDAEIQLTCLLEAIGHIADDVLRESTYPYTEQSQPYNDADFIHAIDAENETTAIALLNGALREGLHFNDLESALTRAALLHYNDFGHSLIYVAKAGTLIQRLGQDLEPLLLQSLVRSIVFASREDQIPEFRSYKGALANWGKEGNSKAPAIDDYRNLTINKALRLTSHAGSASAEALYRALLGANAANLLNYDIAYQYHADRPISDNVGWLSFTHGITFANAVRKQCLKFPECWPQGLLQMACFSGRNTPFTDFEQDISQWRIDDNDAFFRASLDFLFDHGREEFIVSVHILKTLLATREESQYVDSELSVILSAALNRFLHSPLRRKHVKRTVHQALAFVTRDQ